MPLDEARIPVVVGTGQVTERTEVVSPVELAARAVDAAFARAEALRSKVQRLSMVGVLSNGGTAPATALARRAGLSPARVETTTIGGNTPQWLLNRAARSIAHGELEVVLVAGAEAQRSARVLRDSGAPGVADVPAAEPDPLVGDDRPGVGAPELTAGLSVPVHVYAMFESVLAARAGRTPAEQRRALGELMAPFTAVAATHPNAWFPVTRTPAELAGVDADNRLVSEPYPKRMCAIMRVDQGAAVVVTSLAAARAAGLADDAVFMWSGADAADVWFPSARPDPGDSPGIRAAATAALGAAGIGIDDIGAFDLYSCFPSAVQLALAAMGLVPDDTRGLTVTGGLPYFGGPGNDYSLHAVATMTERLRAAGGTGLVSALGWYTTKHSVGVYGADPPGRGWKQGDTTDFQRAIDDSALPVLGGEGGPGDGAVVDGPATVVAATVAYGRDGSVSAAPVIAEWRTRNGGGGGGGNDHRGGDQVLRVVAAAHAEDLPALAGTSLVGAQVSVGGHPPRYRRLT